MLYTRQIIYTSMLVHPYCNVFPPKKFSQTKQQPEMKRILNLTAISLLLLLSVLYTMVHCQEKEEEQQQQYTRDQCLSFGFVTEKLACGVCREMSTFISETSLINQCNACCNPSLDSEKKYKRATLEICQLKLLSFPEVRNFIDKRSRLFKDLRVVYRMHASPILIMEDKNGNKETLSLEKWSNDDIFNYLSQSIN
jgi:hypothetical protein